MKIDNPAVTHSFFEGVISGANVKHYRKEYREIMTAYARTDETVPADTLMYEVYTGDWEESSDALLWGLTVLYPVTVGGECNMTRGHFHQDRSKPEIYFGCGGDGLLLFMDEEGDVFGERISSGSVHYIQGKYAHRIINTGDQVLKVGACWTRNAGHDYLAVERRPFPVRIYKESGRICIEEGGCMNEGL